MSALAIYSNSVEIGDPIQNYDLLKVVLYSDSIEIAPFPEAVVINTFPQLGVDFNCYVMREVSAGVWESSSDFEVVDPTQDLLAVIGASSFTAQELRDMAAASGGAVTIVHLEDTGVTVDPADYETNVHHLTVLTSEGTKYVYPKINNNGVV